MPRNVARWLLRVLVEPSFLRYYVLEPGLPLSLSAFEAEFFALAADQERPEGARRQAWRRLQRWAPLEAAQGAPSARWFQCILRGLRDDAELDEALCELARFWALQELLGDGDESGPGLPPYHELHCHFRGGVPFFVLWHGLLFDARQRATLRNDAALDRECRISWAELVEQVVQGTPHGAVETVHDLDENDARERVVVRVRDILDVARPLEDLRRDVQYVAACAGLATHLRHQRTPGGLAPFVKSYERYSKVQKRGGIGDCRHRPARVPDPPASPVTRDPPGGGGTVLRLGRGAG